MMVVKMHLKSLANFYHGVIASKDNCLLCGDCIFMSHKGGKDKTVQRSVIATFEPWPSHFSDLVKTEKVTMEEAYDSLLIERTDLHHVKAT
jgi:hypothetical protein